jgi:hypothetical protein
MALIDQWRTNAAKRHGDLVVWIAQGSDPNLKSANFEGVCAAIVREFLSNSRKYRSNRAAFVDSFRQYDDAGNIVGYSIPTIYLQKQADLQREFDQYKKRFVDLGRRTIAYRKDNPTDTHFYPALRETMKIYERVMNGGVDCIKFFAAPSLNEALLEVASPLAPVLYELLMKDSGGRGHRVGFEMRPDQSAGRFNQIHQFLDPNLGLFVFGNPVDLWTFVESEVWPALYAGRYDRFDLMEYDIGLGGFGLSPEEKKKLEDEALDAELAELERELEQQDGNDS